jgi:hypothetical protein
VPLSSKVIPATVEKLSFREVQMSEDRNMFETQPVARSTREQEDELTERSAELLEEVALQMVVLGTALIGAFLGLLIFSEIPLRLPVGVRLMVTAALSFLFVAMLFSLPVLLPGKEIDPRSGSDSKLRLWHAALRRKSRFGRLAAWMFVSGAFFMLLAILILLVRW